jgi:O-antigen/teichoic acid export membrane protein
LKFVRTCLYKKRIAKKCYRRIYADVDVLGQKMSVLKNHVAFLKHIDNSLTGKATLNAVTVMVDYIARMLVSLLMNPILVAGLGDYLFGVWQILGRLMGYVAIAGGKPTQALQMTIAKQQAFDNFEEKRRQVGSSFVASLLFFPVFLTVGLILVWYAPALLHAPGDFIIPIRIATAVLMVNVFFLSIAELPRSVLAGQNLGYKRLGLSTVLVFIHGGMLWLALALGWGIVGVSAATITTTLITGSLFWALTRSNVSWFGVARPSFVEVKLFFTLTGGFFVGQIITQLLLSGDVLILGVLVSAEVVTVYSLTKYLGVTIVNLVAVIMSGVIPGLGGILGKGDYHFARLIRSDMLALTWLTVVTTGSTILAWNPAFIRMWVGEAYYAGTMENLLIIVLSAQLVFLRNEAGIIDLNLSLRDKNILGILAVLVSFATSSALLLFWQESILALCLGFSTGIFILNIGYPVLVMRILHLNWRQELRVMIRPVLVTIVVVFVFLLSGSWFAANNWLSLAFFSGLTFTGVACFSFLFGLQREQQKRLLARIKRFF